MKLHLLLISATVLFFISCSNKEEKELKEKVSAGSSELVDKVVLDKTRLSEYKDIELKLNENYIHNLNELVDNNFENQLKEFQDHEMGIISGYKYMFKHLISSKQEWEDIQVQLSDKYFNPLQLKQKAVDLNQSYIKDVKQLRTQFCTSSKGAKDLSIKVLEIPDSNVYLESFGNYQGKGLVIEIGTFALDWLLGILIVWILSLFAIVFIPVPIISTILTLIISFICVHVNDKKIVNSLREQQEEIVIDYNTLKSELDTNTIHFYETYK